MKSASENLNGVLERTKLKRVWSRPGSLTKRNSVFHDTGDTADECRSEPNRRTSLPVDDIFNKISFASPLDIGTQIKHWRGDFDISDTKASLCRESESKSKEHVADMPSDEKSIYREASSRMRQDSETGSDVTSVADSSVFFYDAEGSSPPPPSYPPPPLPCDEVTSAFCDRCEDSTAFPDRCEDGSEFPHRFEDSSAFPADLSSHCDESDVSSQAESYFTIGTIDTDSFCDEVLDTVNRMQRIRLREDKISKLERNEASKRSSDISRFVSERLV